MGSPLDRLIAETEAERDTVATQPAGPSPLDQLIAEAEAPRTPPVGASGLARAIRAHAPELVPQRPDVTRVSPSGRLAAPVRPAPPPTARGLARALQQHADLGAQRPDATRVSPTGKPGLLERTATAALDLITPQPGEMAIPGLPGVVPGPAVRFAQGLAHPLVTLGKRAAYDVLDPLGAAGDDFLPFKKPTTKESLLAAAQTGAMALAGPAESALATRLGGSALARVAAGTAVGAATGALFTPEDPGVGALLGAVPGAAAGTRHGEPRPALEPAARTAPIQPRGGPEPAPGATSSGLEGVEVPPRPAEAVAGRAGGEAVPARRGAETVEPPPGLSPEQAAEFRRLAREAEEQRRLAETHPLTGLPGARALERARPAAEADPNTAIGSLDINGFKTAQDNMPGGHAWGDARIREVGAIVERIAREHNVRAFHPHGDEYTLIGAPDRVQAATEAIEREYGVREHAPGIKTSISGGIGRTFEEAEAAMYRRKGEQKAAQGIGSRTEAPAQPAGEVRVEPIENIDVEPERFQFKHDVDPTTGAGRELKGVERFNPDLAGVVAVWRDPVDGRLKIVNGHHRYELAKRTGQRTLAVREIQAETAEEARAIGALINISEGRGSPLDVAKFIRDTRATPAAFAEAGVSLRGALASKGLALSKLAPDLFDRVARGEVSEEVGAAVGTVLDAPEQQRAAVELIQRSGRRLTSAEAENVARQVRDAGSTSVTQETLFGTEETALSLAVERARLAEAVKNELARDKRILGFVSREGRAETLQRGGNVINVEESARLAEESAQLTELFDRLASRSGPVGDILTEGARRIAHGERLAQVQADIAPRLKQAVSEALEGAAAERAGTGGGHAPEGATELDAGGRPAEGEAAELEGGVRDSTDEAQAGFFAPEPPERDLFGNAVEPAAPAQGSLFGGQAGAAAGRSLAETEAAARAELPGLRQRLALERDPGRRAVLASRIAQLERLVNRSQAITPEEQATRLAAEGGERPPIEPDQMTMLAPAAEESAVGRMVRKARGLSQADVADVKPLIRIGRGLAEALGVPLRQGRFLAKARRALGVFFPQSEVIRVRRFDRLDTVAHEIGHYVSKKYLKNPTMRGAKARAAESLTQAERAELVKMGRDLYGARKPAAGYGEEGIAQWFRFYVTDPARMLSDAPTFTARMLRILEEREPFLRAVLDQARDDYAAHQAAPPAARVDAMISLKPEARWRPSVKAFIAAIFDDLHEFKVVEQELAALGDRAATTEATKSAYTLARLSRGSAGIAEEAIERGIPHPLDPTAPRLSEGLAQILRRVGPDRLQAFRRYLVGERALEKWAQGIDPGITQADAAAMARAGRAEFGEAAQAIWQYSNALVDYRVEAGLLTPEEGARIKQRNQKRVPFYREFTEEETAAAQGTGKRFGRNSAGVFRMKGSDRPIIDPLQSLIKDTYDAVRAAQMHRVATTLIEMAERTEGGGRIVERLTERPTRRVRLPLAQVLDQLQDMGFTFREDITEAELMALAQEHLTGFEELRTGGPNEAKDLVIPVLKNGRREWYAVKDRALYDALMGLGTQTMPLWLRVLSVPARTLRAGATLTLEFLGRNPVRDAWSAAVYSQAGFRPPGWDFARGLFHALRKDALYQQWKLAGGDNAAMLGLDRPQMQQRLADVVRGRTPITFAADVVRRPIDTLRMLSSLGENATRLGEFAGVQRRALRGGAAPAEATTRAAFAARDVTVDFARAGTQGRMVNQIVAFFNANLQGTAKLAHELRTRPHVILPRAVAAVTVPSIVLYLLNRDDPAYQELPQWEKDLFWIVIQRDETGTLRHLWRIPKPFELGVLFGTVPERIMRRIDQDDPHAFDELGSRLLQTFSPISWPPVGSALTPVIENFANKNTSLDRPVVPGATEGLVPSEQTAPRTGEAARQAGRLLNYSPAKIENYVTGYTAGLGRIGLGLADALTREARAHLGLPPLVAPVRREEVDPLAGVSGVRAFVARPPGRDALSIQRIYDDFATAERKRRTWRRMLSTGRREEARAYFDANRDEIRSVFTGDDPGGAGWLRRLYTRVNELGEKERAILSNPAIDPERARAIRARLDSAAQATARRAVTIRRRQADRKAAAGGVP